MTKAGLDPSRIQERATVLAKVAGAKRKRAEEAEMDVDDDDMENDGEDDDGMDVDGEEKASAKRVKGNSGAVVAIDRRAPKTNRQFAGLRDEGVSLSVKLYDTACSCISSKHPRRSSYGILDSGRETNLPRLERAIVQSKSKW